MSQEHGIAGTMTTRTLELHFGLGKSAVIRYQVESGQIRLLDPLPGMGGLGSDGRRSYAKLVGDTIRDNHPELFRG
jgi:hypothetical protein